MSLSKSATTLRSRRVGPSHPPGGTTERCVRVRCDVYVLLTCEIAKVDAQSKFVGKAYEIRPTGVAHAELILDEDWAPEYPKDKHPRNIGKVVEHYSWKKVITSVSGFMLGSPTIDHYGEMIVRDVIPTIFSLADSTKHAGHQPPNRRSMSTDIQAPWLAREGCL